MSLETEAVLDRRRLKRRLSGWRVFAVVAAFLALLAVTSKGTGGPGFGKRNQIARVTIEGMILEDRSQLKMLKKIADDDSVKALLLFVNSPGGTTTGGEALYLALRNVAKKKPVVAQFGTVAASAAYIAGLGSDHIVARGNTITGSVGVIFQWAEVSELLGKLGVKFNEIKSGNMKAEPSPFKPVTPEGKLVAEEMVAESQKWFLSLVTERRKITTSSVPGLEQGRVYSGRQAVQYKLIDQIGGEAEAITWLETKAAKKVAPNLKVKDWKPSRPDPWGLSAMTHALSSGIFGRSRSSVDDLLHLIKKSGLIRLDGMVSVWHPVKN